MHVKEIYQFSRRKLLCIITNTLRAEKTYYKHRYSSLRVRRNVTLLTWQWLWAGMLAVLVGLTWLLVRLGFSSGMRTGCTRDPAPSIFLKPFITTAYKCLKSHTVPRHGTCHCNPHKHSVAYAVLCAYSQLSGHLNFLCNMACKYL